MGRTTMITGIGLPSEETLLLEKYISEKSDGAEISYLEIIENCKIDIRVSVNRGKFYTACKRLGRECINKPGFGYITSSPSNTLLIADNKGNRILSATTVAVKATTNLENMHGKDLPGTQLETLQHFKYGCSAILGKARSEKRILQKAVPQLSEVKPIV
jgi:hypothetical protein